MKKLITYTMLALSAAMSLTGCTEKSVLAPEEPISIKDAAKKGELLVKFIPEVADIIEHSVATKSGIPTVDEILEIAGTYEFERVFPRDSRTEEETREAGLHLWYIVRFDENSDIEEVGRRLASLGQVSGVEYNHTIKRAYNAEKRAIPFDPSGIALTKSPVRFNDPMLSYQWDMVNDGTLWNRGFTAGADVNVLDAWDLTTGDPSVIVAVLDEGVCYEHPDLAANMWHNEGEIFASEEDNDGNGYKGDYYGYNFVADNGIISYALTQDTGHATHVSGTIAAVNDNGMGISSIAGGDMSHPGVKIMSCQIFSGNQVASILAEVRAVKYAADNGAVILQCSWGYTSSKASAFDWAPQYGSDEEWMTNCPIERDAMLYFINKAGSVNGPIEGGLAVFAAGNESAPAAGYPGAYGEFISVIGTAPDFTPAVYTNYGWRSDICAPGGDQDYFYDHEKNGEFGTIGCILSTLPKHVSQSGYGYMEGSSMACPHISGALALAISYAAQNHRHLKASEYRELLYQTATPIDDFMSGSKSYYKYVADLGTTQKKKMELDEFRGQMGAGQVNTSALLRAVKDAGSRMTFPNVYVATGKDSSYNAALYLDNASSCSVTVADPSVATASVYGSKVVVIGIREGVTKASITAGGATQTFTITVRNSAGEGWL